MFLKKIQDKLSKEGIPFAIVDGIDPWIHWIKIHLANFCDGNFQKFRIVSKRKKSHCLEFCKPRETKRKFRHHPYRRRSQL